MKPASQIASTALEPLRWYQGPSECEDPTSYKQPSTVSGEAHAAWGVAWYRRL